MNRTRCALTALLLMLSWVTAQNSRALGQEKTKEEAGLDDNFVQSIAQLSERRRVQALRDFPRLAWLRLNPAEVEKLVMQIESPGERLAILSELPGLYWVDKVSNGQDACQLLRLADHGERCKHGLLRIFTPCRSVRRLVRNIPKEAMRNWNSADVRVLMICLGEESVRDELYDRYVQATQGAIFRDTENERSRLTVLQSATKCGDDTLRLSVNP